MHLKRVVLGIIAVMAVALTSIVTTTTPAIVQASGLPPFCQGNDVDDDFGDLCDPDFDDGSSDLLPVTVSGSSSGGTLTVVPSIPSCSFQDSTTDLFSPSVCYSGISYDFEPTLCAYVDSYSRDTPRPPTFSSRVVNCDRFPSDQKGPIFGNHIYERNLTRTEPGWDLGLLFNFSETGRRSGELCRSFFNRLYSTGAPAGTWSPPTSCDFPVRDPVPVDGLLGPTWVGARVTIFIEDGATSRSESTGVWIPVDGAERARRPFARAGIGPTGSTQCNLAQFTNASFAQWDNPLEYLWEFRVYREVGDTAESWGTSSAREPRVQFPPSVAADATLTVTDPTSGLSHSDVAFAVVRQDCDVDPDPPGGGGPVVTVEATDATATEAGLGTGTWTLSRTGPTLGPLDVNVSQAGTATEGADYQTVDDTVTFPAGDDEVEVRLTPIDDSLVEANESAVMTVETGPGYSVGDPDEGTIRIISDERPPDEIRPVSPARLVDTRPGEPTVDGRLRGGGAVPAGTVLTIPVRGRGGVPDDATSVVVNTVAVAPSGNGYLTLFPCDEPMPSTSTVNYAVSQPVSTNNAMVKLSASGDLCLFTLHDVQVVLDVTAFALGAEALAPARLVDTRPGEETDDGRFQGIGRLAAGSTTEIDIAGRGGVPADALAVAVNATVVGAGSGGYATLFPCDGPLPLASNVNVRAGETRPNSAVVALSNTGSLCVFSFIETDFVLDVTASFAAAAEFDPLTPYRLLDTRPGERTGDGQSAGIGRAAAGSTTRVQVAGRGEIPDDATAVAINTVAVGPNGDGFLTLFPCDEDRRVTSSLNYGPGDEIANSGIVKLSADGALCIFTLHATHLVLDVNAAWST